MMLEARWTCNRTVHHFDCTPNFVAAMSTGTAPPKQHVFQISQVLPRLQGTLGSPGPALRACDRAVQVILRSEGVWMCNLWFARWMKHSGTAATLSPTAHLRPWHHAADHRTHMTAAPKALLEIDGEPVQQPL